jgi:hypothetical protein
MRCLGTREYHCRRLVSIGEAHYFLIRNVSGLHPETVRHISTEAILI